ncbi:MAG: tRNA (guanosine(37)-N1)-methyltransferase TrmD [Candidatus Colwellbacteria bacterium]|nr:tRNA (guanosine(37)-N1)-methyltransferase TrmD [Candidatus Colwellbacteria bacterium]
MTFDIITLFPDVFEDYFNSSIIGRAKKKGLIKIRVHDLRGFISKTRPDDRPYGGGPGMVIRAEPVIRAIESALKIKNQKSKVKSKIILFSPAGKEFSGKMSVQLVKKYNRFVLIAGHYEGVDERIKKVLKDKGYKFDEISIGNYVLTGGELPAMVVVDAVSRKLKGVLGKIESLEEKRLGVGVPVYTRPEIFIHKGKRYSVPRVLLSGNHQDIEKWRVEHKKK